MSVPLDLSKPETRRPWPVSFTTDQENYDWLIGMEAETKQSRSWIMHRLLTNARQNIGIATVEGERRQGERRSA
jgi:hypothetical protein